jgi:predicted amidohydrolase YtcJ
MRASLIVVVGAACLALACASATELATGSATGPEDAGSAAELVFVSGGVYTVDPQRPWAEAIAVRGGRIVAVGANRDVEPHVGEHTRVVDLTGRMLVPGFHDAHAHPVYAGLDTLECSLSGLASVAAVLDKVRSCLRSGSRRGEWIVGGGWSVALFPNGNAPGALLDEIAADVPIVLMDENGHAVWVNTKALALAGVTANTPDPPAGVIERDPQTGAATGTLRESATKLVYDHVPAPAREQLLRGARLALKRLHRAGITSVVDAAVGEQHLDAYVELADAGELDLRVVACIEVGTSLIGDESEAEGLVARRAEYRRVRIDTNCVKLFADGVLEGETAALLEPYVGRPGYHGESTFAAEELRDLVTRFDSAGLQVHVHAIGDGAVRASLDAFEAARNANGENDHRHNIAHLQLVDPDDVPRFAELDVIANFQAVWAYPDEYVTELNRPVLGEARMRLMYPIGSIHRAGGRLVLGSDWNVTPPDPLPGIEVGLLRRDPTGEITGTLNESESVGLATLIEAYTAGGAFVMHQEDEVGSIEVGKRGDLVVLERDLFSVQPEEIGEVRVLETFVEGRSVFSAP